MGVIRRLVRWAAGLGLAVLAVTVAAVIYLSDRNMQRYGDGRGLAAPVDAILVLGAGIDGDSVIAYSSRRRVAAAVALLKRGKARHLVLAGGRGPDPASPSMAELMRDHAIALGAPPEALLLEDASSSTFENLRFAFALAEARGLERLAVLTDAFHLERARWLAGYFGRPDIALVAAPGLDHDSKPHRAWSILREALAWWYNLAKVAGWEALAAFGIEPEARQEWIR
ncbi:MAG TPA: YdcF family protein [Thermohalobaculum sp.]|nr:YdcF family protein [Thermohalobaculum sp.]